jgi:pimeloyl-ACP methyl ester carboxylesterase
MVLKKIIFLFAIITLPLANVFSQSHSQGFIVTRNLNSTVLRGTRTGLDSNRLIKVYLPPTYNSGKTYPVVYYFHSVFSSAEKTLADGNLVKLIEYGFANRIVHEFILVVADYSSPTTGSLYENTIATGRWLDFTVQELVPFIDRNFCTIRSRDSRAVVGEMMGGRGALMLAMTSPDVFGTVYAMNPVGTGTGVLPVQTYPDWKKILQAKSFSDLQGDHISQLFVTMSQAFLPNPDRPPFYCDFLMELESRQPVYQFQNAQKQLAGFSLDRQLDIYGANLRKLRGIALDWSRYDPIQDHVYGSVALSRKFETLGIEHEAEEYRGVYWTENWKEQGRFYARVLPFLNRYLAFEIHSR